MQKSIKNMLYNMFFVVSLCRFKWQASYLKSLLGYQLIY